MRLPEESSSVWISYLLEPGCPSQSLASILPGRSGLSQLERLLSQSPPPPPWPCGGREGGGGAGQPAGPYTNGALEAGHAPDTLRAGLGLSFSGSNAAPDAEGAATTEASPISSCTAKFVTTCPPSPPSSRFCRHDLVRLALYGHP